MNIITKYTPMGMKDIIYTFRCKSKTKIIRDNVVLSTLLKLNLRANEIRPTRDIMDEYKAIQLKRYDEIDINYDKCIDIPTYNLRELRENRESNEILCGKIIV